MLKFNKNSIHYKLAMIWCDGCYYRLEKNICGYSRQVLGGFGLFMFLTTMAIWLLSISVVLPLMYVLASIQTGIWTTPTQTVVAGVCIDFGILLTIAIVYGLILYTDWRDNVRQQLYLQMNSGNYVPPKDNFIVARYKSFKEKTCVQIDFE